MKKIKDFIKTMFVAGIAMLPIASFADDIKIVDTKTVVIASGNRVDTVRKESDGFFYVSNNIAVNLISRETEFETAQPLSVTSDTTTNLNSIRKAINRKGTPIVNTCEFTIKWGQEKYVFKRKITQSKSISTTAVTDSQNGKQVRTNKYEQINTRKENKPSKVMIVILAISLLGNLVWLCKQQRVKKSYNRICKKFLKRDISETSGGKGVSQGNKDTGKKTTPSAQPTTDLPQTEKDSAETSKETATNGQVTENTQSNESVIFTFAKEIGINVENTADDDSVYEKIREYISTLKSSLEAKEIDEATISNLSALDIKSEGCTTNAIIAKLIKLYDDNKPISFEEQLSKVKNDDINRILCNKKKPNDLNDFCKIITEYIANFFEKVINSKEKTKAQQEALRNYVKSYIESIISKEGEGKWNTTLDSYFKKRLGDCFDLNLYNIRIDDLRNNYKIIKESETNATSKAKSLDEEEPTTTTIAYTIPDDKQKMLDEYSHLMKYGNDASTIERSIKDLVLKEDIGEISITEIKNRIAVYNELSTCYGKNTSEDIENAIKNKVAKLFSVSESVISELKDENLKELLEAINKSEDIDSLDKAFVDLVNSVTKEFAQKDSSIEELHGEQKNLLDKILEKYQEVFNDEKIEEEKAINAFGAFATKTSNVLCSTERQLQEASQENSKYEKEINTLNAQLDEKEQKIKDLSQECINQVSTTFETIRQSLENTCEEEYSDVAKKFQQLVLNNSGYNLKNFSEALFEILTDTKLCYDDKKKQIKELCERALVENSWIHALTRMYLYVQQPKIADKFEKDGVVTSKIERAFIITEQLLKEIGIELSYPMLFKDVYDDKKYEYRSLADINNIVGSSLVKDLVGEKTNVLIDLHRVGFNSDTENAKPKVSKFS